MDELNKEGIDLVSAYTKQLLQYLTENIEGSEEYSQLNLVMNTLTCGLINVASPFISDKQMRERFILQISEQIREIFDREKE